VSVRRLVSACCVATLTCAACNASSARSADDYCRRLSEQQQLLVAPITSTQEIIDTIARYRAFGESAPLDVDEQWGQLADLLEHAANLDLTDPIARQALANEAYSQEKAAREIADHAATACSIDTLQLIVPPPITSPPRQPSDSSNS
jgi:hypothetical protein